MTRGRFCTNTAVGRGGAVRVESSVAATNTIRNSVFIGNGAPDGFTVSTGVGEADRTWARMRSSTTR